MKAWVRVPSGIDFYQFFFARKIAKLFFEQDKTEMHLNTIVRVRCRRKLAPEQRGNYFTPPHVVFTSQVNVIYSNVNDLLAGLLTERSEAW